MRVAVEAPIRRSPEVARMLSFPLGSEMFPSIETSAPSRVSEAPSPLGVDEVTVAGWVSERVRRLVIR
jgi:hypothetical protein